MGINAVCISFSLHAWLVFTTQKRKHMPYSWDNSANPKRKKKEMEPAAPAQTLRYRLPPRSTFRIVYICVPHIAIKGASSFVFISLATVHHCIRTLLPVQTPRFILLAFPKRVRDKDGGWPDEYNYGEENFVVRTHTLRFLFLFLCPLDEAQGRKQSSRHSLLVQLFCVVRAHQHPTFSCVPCGWYVDSIDNAWPRSSRLDNWSEIGPSSYLLIFFYG